MNQFMKNNIYYDSKYDVLNIKFSSTKNSYGDEEIDNIILLKDFKDDKITGITILDFKKMYDRNDERMKEINKYIDSNADVYSAEVTVNKNSLKSFEKILKSNDIVYVSKTPIADIKDAKSIKKYFKN